jgi:hypothetical protein
MSTSQRAIVMLQVKGIPLAGQGKPLPKKFPYVGQWILEDRIFLYRPKPQQFLGGPAMTLLLAGGPQWCFGINAIQLALALGVESGKIFEHNKNGALFLVRTDNASPSRGVSSATRYVFQIGACQTEFVVQTGTQSSNL